jgi:phospholipase/carboxylesterase
VAPRAPFAAAPLGYGPGFAWYRYLGGARPDPDHFQHSLDELHTLLDALPSHLPVQPGPLFLGGFSQGGTVSLGYALGHPERIHTVLNLSGFLADHPAVKVTLQSVAHTRFYWPHGTLDANIPHTLAQQGRGQLLAADAFLAAPDYPIGHTINHDEIGDIRELLRTI